MPIKFDKEGAVNQPIFPCVDVRYWRTAIHVHTPPKINKNDTNYTIPVNILKNYK